MLLFSNEQEKELGTQEEILEMYKESADWDLDHDNGEQPNERDVFEWAERVIQDYCDDFFEELPDMVCILHGTAGTWRGPREGGKIDKLYNLLVEAQEDYNTFELDEKEGIIKVTAIHHDGTNHWEVKALTQKGIDYWQNHSYDDPRELHNHILNTKGYTKKIKYWM